MMRPAVASRLSGPLQRTSADPALTAWVGTEGQAKPHKHECPLLSSRIHRPRTPAARAPLWEVAAPCPPARPPSCLGRRRCVDWVPAVLREFPASQGSRCPVGASLVRLRGCRVWRDLSPEWPSGRGVQSRECARGGLGLRPRVVDRGTQNPPSCSHLARQRFFDLLF